jgi:LCP family protein required for cell wall assembly
MNFDGKSSPNEALDDWSDWAVPKKTKAPLAVDTAPSPSSASQPSSRTQSSPSRTQSSTRPRSAAIDLSKIDMSKISDATDELDDLDLDDQEYFARLDRRAGLDHKPLANDRRSPAKVVVPAVSAHSNGHSTSAQPRPSAPAAPNAASRPIARAVSSRLNGRVSGPSAKTISGAKASVNPAKLSGDTKTAEATPSGPIQAAPRPLARKVTRVMLRTSLVVGCIVLLLVGYVVVRLNQTRRIAEPLELDRTGGPPRTTLTTPTTSPNDTVATTDVVPTTASESVTTIVSRPAGRPAASTIPGDGSCADDPACASAPVVSLPPKEVPKANYLLVDPVDLTPIGGLDAENTLIIGTDSRKDVSAAEQKTFGKVGGSRSDTIMVLRNDKSGSEAGILSYPRDTYVHIAGTNKNDRINSAYAGGMSRLVKTIQENFGTPINHVVEIDFGGFERVVSTLGGVNICFKYPSRDTVTGLNQPAGCNLLDPSQAIAYVRSRHFENQIDGKWKSDERGDLGRIDRQQTFIKRVLQRAIDQGGRNPITGDALLRDMQKAIRIDKTYGTTDLLSLANTFRAFEPDSLQTFKILTSPATIDGKAVLRVDRAKSSEVVALFGKR